MSLPDKQDVGVIIGRFQVPELHIGHKKLFDTVLARHKRVLVLLGVPAWRGGVRHPMDYNTRRLMIESAYPDVTVLPIKDRQTNEEWSKDVDDAIRNVFPLERVSLYGGRKGFTSFYRGGYPTIETLEDPTFDSESGTRARDDAASLPRNTADFRAGVIYSAYQQPTGPCMCIDGAVTKGSGQDTEILLVRKPGEIAWRFPGGRLDCGDACLEDAIKREIREETGVEIGEPTYVASSGPIPDWRGQRSGISIFSALFLVPYIYGAPKGQDDVESACWFTLKDLATNHMEPCHRQLLAKLQQHLKLFKENNAEAV